MELQLSNSGDRVEAEDVLVEEELTPLESLYSLGLVKVKLPRINQQSIINPRVISVHELKIR